MTPQTWFTADTHFAHARIIALANRPFHDVREMDEALIRNWNDRVQPNDVVWHVGDFAFGNDAARLDEIFARLNGIKHLVPGNHDDDKDETLTLPWASISQIATINVDSTIVVLCHYPMKTWPRAGKGAIHLYGHMHGRLKGTSRSLDIGVDPWDFRPVSLGEIRQRLKTLPLDLDFADDPNE